MGKIRITTAGAETLEVEDEGRDLEEILQLLRDEGFTFGGNMSLGGMPVPVGYVPKAGDVVETHDTPKGN